MSNLARRGDVDDRSDDEYGVDDLDDDITDAIDDTMTREGLCCIKNHACVFFDLETTGYFTPRSEIIQIAAKCGKQEFNVYIYPENEIPSEVQKLTKLSTSDGKMLLDGRQVPTQLPKIALWEFLRFLEKLGDPIVLISHNGFCFDAPFIIRDMRSADVLWRMFDSLVVGFADTLPILKEKLPQKRAINKLKFNLKDLGTALLGKDAVFGMHDALNDVKLLERIMIKAHVTPEDLIGHTESVAALEQQMEASRIKTENKNTMSLLIKKGCVTEDMVNKMAKAGINLKMLQDAYNRIGNYRGVADLLSQDVGGRPRVTKNQRVITNVESRVKKSVEEGLLSLFFEDGFPGM